MSDISRNGYGNSRPRTAYEALQPSAPPPPPKRSQHARHIIVVVLNFFITLMVLSVLAGSAALYFGKQRFAEPGPLEAPRTLVIKEGSSVSRIAEQLRAANIIDNEWLFIAGVRAHRAGGDLKAGEYAFSPAMSMQDVMHTIRSGKGVLYKITFPEGLTSYKIFERLRGNEMLVGELPKELPPEGSLLPDTYPFQRGTSRADIVAQMQRQQQRALAEIWSKRIDGLPLKSPEELVILASIVEKETGRADERPRVASVFINRLNKKMRLQSDPTILYGLFGGQGRPPERPIYRSDIDKHTPYNTYQIDGLPPGPIANPGRAAMEAVANPSRTKDFYFVADGTGGHVFAGTLDDHNENVRRWRVIRKKLQEDAAKQNTQLQAEEDVMPDVVETPDPAAGAKPAPKAKPAQ